MRLHIINYTSRTLLTIFLLLTTAFAKETPPKLIVSVTLDQFPEQYLVKFRPYFGKGGFNLLLEQGANYTNATYKHAFNKTAPGHAAIYSGCYGNRNGIVGNDWYDRATKKSMYCVEDTGSHLLPAGKAGRSPKNSFAYSFGDMLRLSSNFKSKVIGISGKDRSSILPAGKLANAAYWLQDSQLVSSTYYMEQLPAWVERFNNKGTINACFGAEWKKILPESAYALCDDDNVPYETDANGMGKIFPHIVKGKNQTISKSFYYAFLASPFAIDVTLQFAKECIEQEQLGKRGVTDMLCVGISATDEAGHDYGPNSQEEFDIVIRTDRMLSDFFKFLDTHIGANEYIITLTADHGVAPIPEYITKNVPHAPVGRLPRAEVKKACMKYLAGVFGTTQDSTISWIEEVSNHNIYISQDVCDAKKIAKKDVIASLQQFLLTMPGIASAFATEDLMHGTVALPFSAQATKSYYPSRSGDILIIHKPYYVDDAETGTGHGMPYEYDSHVPLIFYGKGIKKLESNEDCAPIDLPATLAALLHIPPPPMSEGRVLGVGNGK